MTEKARKEGKLLQRLESIPFADKILGRPIIYRDTRSERELGPAMTKIL